MGLTDTVFSRVTQLLKSLSISKQTTGRTTLTAGRVRVIIGINSKDATEESGEMHNGYLIN